MTNRISYIFTPDAPEPGAYSQAILVDMDSYGELIMAGQTGNIPGVEGEPVITGGIGPQTTQILQNILAIIKAAGGNVNHILKLEVALKDPATLNMTNVEKGKIRGRQRVEFNNAYRKFFASHGRSIENKNMPARVLTWVVEVPLEWPTEDTQIEINPTKVIIY